MKVVRIQKTWSAGRDTWHIVLDMDASEDDVEYQVERACEKHTGGHNNGYSYEWEDETDPGVIKDVLIKEDKHLVEQIKRLRDRMLYVRETLIKMDQKS